MSSSRHSRQRFISGLGAALAVLQARGVEAATIMNVLNDRPYDFSTHVDQLGSPIFTSNEAFFIRSHMGPPPSIDVHSWRLTLDGLVQEPMHLTLAELKRFPKHELPALLQCSGNGRWYYGEAYPNASHPAGAQWRRGGIGNARWAGARVRDVLAQAKLKPNARFATNFGMDSPIMPQTPKFIRGIEIEKLLDEDTLLVYEMNGEPLPYYHGYPVRLIVPGWAADHSVKWLTNMTITDELADEFWTASAYRYPNKLDKPGTLVKPGDEHPVTALNVKSIITTPHDKATVRVGSPLVVSGFAWSGGGAYAKNVDVSFDNGKTWKPATLGESPGKYSWRIFTARFVPSTAGTLTVLARATDNRGSVQPKESPWNPGGYLWNGISKVTLEVRNA